MRMVKADALLSWTHLKESRTLDASEYIECVADTGVPPPYRLVFVSHRWIAPTHPDPRGVQLVELQRRLSTLSLLDGKLASLLVFY